VRVRDRARKALAGPAPDADALVGLALADAFLTLEHGEAAAKSADEALRRLPADEPAEPAASGTRRGCAGLARAGCWRSRYGQAACGRRAGLGCRQPPPALLLLPPGSGLAGDTTGAGRIWTRLCNRHPNLLRCADWAAQRLDSGDAMPLAVRRMSFWRRTRRQRVCTCWPPTLSVPWANVAGLSTFESACRSEGRVSRAGRALARWRRLWMRGLTANGQRVPGASRGSSFRRSAA